MGMLDRRVIIVTGGAKGIGLAYCRGLAAEGATVVVADLSDGGEVVAELRDSGAEAMSAPTDVSDVAQTEAMAAATVGAYGRIDGQVESAGIHRSRQVSFVSIIKKAATCDRRPAMGEPPQGSRSYPPWRLIA